MTASVPASNGQPTPVRNCTTDIQSSSSHIPVKREEDVIELSDSEEDVKPAIRTSGLDLWEAGHIQELTQMARDQRLRLEYSFQK